jgi:hypothetical protein
VELYPADGESREEWVKRMKETAHIRRRAKEIYDQMLQEKAQSSQKSDSDTQ